MNSFRWVSFPVKDESFYKTTLLLLLIVSFFIFTSYILNIFLALLGVIVLLVALAKYFFPTQYEVNEFGVKLTWLFFSSTKKWSEFSRYVLIEGGVFLSPFRKPSKLDTFRGLFLRANRKIELSGLIEIIKKNLEKK